MSKAHLIQRHSRILFTLEVISFNYFWFNKFLLVCWDMVSPTHVNISLRNVWIVMDGPESLRVVMSFSVNEHVLMQETKMSI